MNKASCFSLASNIILYLNTLKINGTIESLRRRGRKRRRCCAGAYLTVAAQACAAERHIFL